MGIIAFSIISVIISISLTAWFFFVEVSLFIVMLIIVYLWLNISFIRFWYKHIFSHKNEDYLIEKMVEQWTMMKILYLFWKIIGLGIIIYVCNYVILFMLTSTNKGDGYDIFLIGLFLVDVILFLFYCFCFCETAFGKGNSEKISQNNISETENHSK